MRFIHLSDLHLGLRLNKFSLLEDQSYILDRIFEIIGELGADAVIIAGDIYDKPVSPAEAVSLFDSFITRLSDAGIKTLMISGNHDSAERVAFGSGVMSRGGIHIAPVYDGKTKPVVLHDGFGDIFVYLLPFLKPSSVRRYFPDKTITTHNDALKAAVGAIETDDSARSIIVSHQFVTGAVTCDSEEIYVGGLENIDASIYEKFDYAALGHIHRPQNIAGERIRYCGTPLKYSFSEANDQKSVTVIDMKEKGNVSVDTVPLTPLHDLREIRGTYMELTSTKSYTEENRHDYIKAVLTDETEINMAMDRLRAVYPNIMQLSYDNTATRTQTETGISAAPEMRSPVELACDFYRLRSGTDMTEEKKTIIQRMIDEIAEEDI